MQLYMILMALLYRISYIFDVCVNQEPWQYKLSMWIQ